MFSLRESTKAFARSILIPRPSTLPGFYHLDSVRQPLPSYDETIKKVCLSYHISADNIDSLSTTR